MLPNIDSSDHHGIHGRVIVHADLDCFYCQVRIFNCVRPAHFEQANTLRLEVQMQAVSVAREPRPRAVKDGV